MDDTNRDVSREVFFRFLTRYRRLILWSISTTFFLWIFLSVREVTTLLLLSYGLVMLMEPLVQRFEARRFSRGAINITVQIVFVLVVALLVARALPRLIEQYNNLVHSLPNYVHASALKIKGLLEQYVSIELPESREEYVESLRGHLSAVGIDQLKAVADSILTAVLGGYSATLWVINLLLLPFFIYYIGVELPHIHKFVYRNLPIEIRDRTVKLLQQIMGHVYAFFKGQLTVSAVMAILYWLGLLAVGLPSAFVVGMLSGFLNIVPYLGISIGIVLATIITLVTEPHFTQLLLVWGVFVAVQLLEGFVLTPKIVGEQVGIHALTVILALIIGAQLFGLAGMILAIPGAAAIKVLVQDLLLEEVAEER